MMGMQLQGVIQLVAACLVLMLVPYSHVQALTSGMQLCGPIQLHAHSLYPHSSTLE